jgi:hypothetical protein
VICNSSKTRLHTIYLCLSIRYILLGIIAVIVLLNVLIAVVVDSYGNVKNKASEEVFWSSRLEFATEVEVTSNLITQLQSGTFAKAWTSILKVYEDKRNDDEKANGSIAGSKFMCYLILRLIFIPVIVIWFTGGAFTFGLLWPPRLRERGLEILDSILYASWTSVARVFEDKRSHNEKRVPFGSKSLYYLIPRVTCALIIIIWLIIGALLCGFIWPPQVRKMFWDSCCPPKRLTDEDLWKESIQDIKRIVKDQETAKMSEMKFKHIVTEMKAELAKVMEKSDKVAEIINNNSNQMTEMMKQITQLLKEKEEMNDRAV